MESNSSGASPMRGPQPDCGRPDLAGRLAPGDELSGAFATEMAAHAESCPSCAVRLSLIQQAERWLADRGSSNRGGVRGSTPCPAAEELFDYGRGPGARGLALSVERRVEAHLVDCEDCRLLVATLAMRPPAPLLDRSPAPVQGRVPEESGSREPHTAPARPTLAPVSAPARAPRRTWVPYAAAAAVVLAAAYWWQTSRDSLGAERGVVASTEIDYPELELLRGDTASSLRAPHGRVLASTAEAAGGTWHPLRFVIAPQPGAKAYKVRLLRASASAFGDDESVASLTVTSNEFTWTDDAARSLPPGNYSWEAWALVNELEVYLDKQDFRICDDPAARQIQAQCAALPEPARSSTLLAWLVAHKYATDAHAVAASLPESAARNAFLDQVLAR
jgi:hypothetical protein